MNDPSALIGAASAATGAIGIASIALLKAWRGWIELRRQQIADGRSHGRRNAPTKLTELQERVRRLEAIANGVDF